MRAAIAAAATVSVLAPLPPRFMIYTDVRPALEMVECTPTSDVA